MQTLPLPFSGGKAAFAVKARAGKLAARHCMEISFGVWDEFRAKTLTAVLRYLEEPLFYCSKEGVYLEKIFCRAFSARAGALFLPKRPARRRNRQL